MEKQTNLKCTVKQLRILYPIWALLGMFSVMYVPSVIVEFGEPVKTVENIITHSLLFRLGIAGRLVTQLLFVIIPFLLYQLFRNLDKLTASLMLIFALVSVPISMLSEATNIYVLSCLDKPNKVMEVLGLYKQVMHIPIIFWGLWLLPLGRLAYKYGLFPKLIGVALFVGGLGYLISSFKSIVFPDFDQLNFVWEIMTFGELIFILWFVILGIRKQQDADL